MKKNYLTTILKTLLILVISTGITTAQSITVNRYDVTTGWSKPLTSNQSIAFPTPAAANSSLNFKISNPGPVNLTFSTPVISGANAADFTLTTAPSSPVAPIGSTNFVITYNPADSLVSNATITIVSNAGTFVINLTGSGKLFYGAMFPPLPAYSYSLNTSGSLGFNGGLTYSFSSIQQANKQKTYWGPDMNNSGFLRMRCSMQGNNYQSYEHFTYSPSESNLSGGLAKWRANTYLNGNFVYLLCVLQTSTALTDPSSIGISEEVGGLVYIPNGAASYTANYIIYASYDNNSWDGYLDFYNNHHTGYCDGCAYVDLSSGFYWKDIAPKLTLNIPLAVNEGGSAIIVAGTNLDAIDDEDLPGHPERILFNFDSQPSDFGVGQVLKNGVPMTSASTFTLQDVQNNLITYQHDGSQSTNDQFQFSIKDGRGELGGGNNTVFNFNINITLVNQAPVARDTSFTSSYASSITKNLYAYDVDGPFTHYSIISNPDPAKGNITGFNTTTGQFTYNPVYGAPTSDFFTYQATDGSLLSAIKTVSITQVNLPPTTSNVSVSTMEGNSVSGTLTANDPEGGTPITFQIVSNGANGSATVSSNGNYTYQPNANVFGADFFTFKAQDPIGAFSVTDTVFVRVIPRLDTGDIIIANQNKLQIIDPLHAQDTILTSGQGLNGSINLAYVTGSSVFVFDGSTGLVKADPTTGNQSLVSARNNFSGGGPIGGAAGMVIDNNGHIVLADATNGIVSVDSSSGVVTPLFNGGNLTFVTGLVYLGNGDMIVLNIAGGPFGSGTRAIIRITPSGVQSVVSTGNYIGLPTDIALIDQNTVVVSDAGGFVGGSDNIYKVDLTTGIQTLISTGGYISTPTGIDYSNGNVFAVNKGNNGTGNVISVDVTSGVQTFIRTVSNPWGLMVVKSCITPFFTGNPGNQAANIIIGCSASVNYTSSVSGSPSPVITYVFSGATTGSGSGDGGGSVFNVGATTVTLSATNSCGTSTCQFTVTVNDNIPPVLSGCTNIAQNNDNGSCSAAVTFANPTATDNCGGSSLFYDPNTMVLFNNFLYYLDGTNGVAIAPGFELGSNSDLAAILAANPNAFQGKNYYSAVSDNCCIVTTDPTEAYGMTDNCDYTGPFSADQPILNGAGCSGSDNHFANQLSFFKSSTAYGVVTALSSGLASGSDFPVGITVNTFTATDSYGNTSTCSFTVTVTDNEGPVITNPSNITQNTDNGVCHAVVTFIATAIDNCGVSTVVSNPSSGSTFNIGNTTVTTTATDIHGNTSIASFIITVQAAPFTQPGTITGNTGVCHASSQTYSIAAVNGATGYSWTLPSGWSGTSATTSITCTAGTAGGNVRVTAHNLCSNSAASNLVVTVSNTLPAQPGTISGNTTVCQSSIQTYSIASVSGATSYTWTLPNGWTGTSATASITTTIGSGSGSITVKSNNGCGSSALKSLAITVNPSPAVTITGATNGCVTVTLTASGGTTYHWSGGSSTGTAINAFTSSGTYTVTVTNSGGCTGTGSKAVTVNANPTATISGTTTACARVILTAGGGTGYSWSGGSSTNTAVNTFTISGNYSVTVSNAGGCTATASRSVTVNSNPTATITGAATGCGSVTLTASGGTTYQWSNGPLTNIVTITSTGSHSYEVTVTDGNSCSGTASKSITVYSNPVPVISGTTTGCVSVTLTASGGTGYQWSGGSSTGTAINTFTSSGTYTVTVTNSNGCTATASSAVTVNPVNAVTITAFPSGNFCSYVSPTYVRLMASSGFNSYAWTPTGGYSQTATASATGTYTVTASYSTGCTSTATKTVTNNCPVPTNEATSNITGSTATVSWTASQCGYNYTLQRSVHGLNSWTSFTIPGTSYTFTGLTSGTSYDCRVKTNCNTSGTINSAFTSVITFTTSGARTEEDVTTRVPFYVYPNPAETQVTIAFSTLEEGVYTIKLVDMMGRVVKSEVDNASSGDNTYIMNLDGVAKGVYMVVFQKGNNISKAKLVIE